MRSRLARRGTSGASRERFATFSKKPLSARRRRARAAAGESFASGRSRSGDPSIPAKRFTTDALLVDTNVLLEATDEKRGGHAACLALLETYPELRTSSQVVREYLVVATRPAAANGLGLPLIAALANVREFRRTLRLLPEEKPTLAALLSLLEEVPCQGKRIHDAHLVATAIVHRLRTIVTLNGDDFEPFSARVETVEPGGLLRGARR